MVTLDRPVACELFKLLFLDITSPDMIARMLLHFPSSLAHSIFAQPGLPCCLDPHAGAEWLLQAHLGAERLLRQLLPQAPGAGLAAAGREGLTPLHRGGVDVPQTTGGSPQQDCHFGASGSRALSELCLLAYLGT